MLVDSIKNWFQSWLPTRVEFREVQDVGSYDSVPAVTTCDSFTGPETADGQVRYDLQQKSCNNDCTSPYYAKALNLHSSMVVGKGPKVIITDERITPDDRAHLKKRWYQWCKRSGFVRTLRAYRRGGMKIGEGLGYYVTAAKSRDPVKLKFVDVSATRLETPIQRTGDASVRDGIEYGDDGQPSKFYINMGGNDIKEFDASKVAYWYCCILEEQKRGVPELHTTLDWFPKITNFQNAVISGMELFARMPIAMEVDAAWISDEDKETGCPSYKDKPFRMPTNGLMVPTLPKGTKLNKFQGEAPGTDSKQSLTTIVTMAVSPIQMPAILIMSDAGDASFSAANIDWEPYLGKIYEDREELEPTCSMTFEQWIIEGAKIPGYFGPSVVEAVREDLKNDQLDIDHEWKWGRVKCHIDPNKEASARAKDLESGAVTLMEVYESRNEDFEERVEQAAKAYGVTEEEYKAMLWAKLSATKGVSNKPTPKKIGRSNANEASNQTGQ